MNRININVSKMGFWLLARIAYDAKLVAAVRDETAHAFQGDGLDMKYLTERCPLLKSIWLESLRLVSGISSVRHVTEDTVIGGKVVRQGSKVMVSGRQLHLDEAVWGRDAHEFNPQRFLQNPKLEHHPSFRPFGGGATLCPGRIFARHLNYAFVALVLHRFEIELAAPQHFPNCEAKDAGFGITMSKDDLLVKLSTRKE